MGIEVIRLSDGKAERVMVAPPAPMLARMTCRAHVVPDPAMSIWVMSLSGTPFSWWGPGHAASPEGEELSKTWGVSNPQALFDCLFLSQLKRTAGSNLHAIFPGYVKADGWDGLRENDRQTFREGQGCVYHLEGALTDRLSINWVPFGQPQSVVRDPSLGSLWRIFGAPVLDEPTRCLSFFSLSSRIQTPDVVSLLVKDDDHRSEKLADVVDWFGAFFSPMKEGVSACAVFYTRKKNAIQFFGEFERQVRPMFESAQAVLAKEAMPNTAIKIVSRQVAL